MDSNELVRALSKAATDLTEALRRRGITISHGAWMHYAEESTWQLVIATKAVETLGPVEVYSIVREEAGKLHLSVPLRDISVVRPGDPFVSYMQSHFPSPYKGEDPKYWRISPSATVSSVSSAVSSLPVDAVIVYPSTKGKPDP